MTDTFSALLQKRVNESSSLLCVGLDPHLPDLSSPTAEGALQFCSNLIQQTAPYAAAFKPNAAFFEVFGADGWKALQEVIRLIREVSARLGSNIPIILDAKRGDIASTAEAYAKSAFETLGVESITLSPYMGRDSITPFLKDPAHGAFLLCKTSNAGSGDLQDLQISDNAGNLTPLYLRIALLADLWNVNENLGLVVGATYPEVLASVRKTAPELWILVPGIGAQGGDLKASLQAGLRADGSGVLINVSRGISRAETPCAAARDLQQQIETIRTSLRT